MSSYEDWSDWNKLVENDWYEYDGYGNNIGWVVQWRSSPEDYDVQGIKTNLNINPNNPPEDQNRYVILEQDYNSSYAQIEEDDYRPYNSRGSTSSTWDIGLDISSLSDLTLGVGHSSSHSKSELDIDDKSSVNDPSKQNIHHKYDISGDLSVNTVRMDQVGIADANPTSGETFVNVDLEGYFWRDTVYTSAAKNSYRYYWG